MRVRFRVSIPALSFLLSLALIFSSVVVSSPVLHAQEPSGSAPAATEAPDHADNSNAKAPESREDQQTEAMRHSSAVQWIARSMHVSTETAAKIFEDLNSGILIAVILIFLFRVLPKAFRSRTGEIQKQLVDARTATEEANERLSAVEKRLSRLDDEIAALVRQTEADSAQDETRIRQAIEDEKQRIIQSAEHEIDAAGSAAQRQLTQFAAELAIDRAIQGVRLTPETDRVLIEDFGRSLAAQGGKDGRN